MKKLETWSFDRRRHHHCKPHHRADPAMLPVAGATQFTLSVRRSSLAKLGLTIPRDIAVRVNDWLDGDTVPRHLLGR